VKARARTEKGQIAVFFIDDNFAINIKRTNRCCATSSPQGAGALGGANQRQSVARRELVDLIADSGGKWIFIGMESIDPANLKDVNKGFNKPGEYAAVLERLAARNVYASRRLFSHGQRHRRAAERTMEQVRTCRQVSRSLAADALARNSAVSGWRRLGG